MRKLKVLVILNFAIFTSIEYVKLFDDNNHIHGRDFTALGLTDKFFLCHYDIRGAADKYAVRQFIGYDNELVCISGNDIVCLTE